MCTDGAGYVPCFMSLLIGEYYGEPRQSFGHSHGGKHVRTLLMEVRDAQICYLCWLVRKLC